MNFNCANCGWSEIVGSPIMCNYSGHRTWRDECCEAWKPKEKETNMVEVVRCKDCKKWHIDCLPNCGRHGCDVIGDYTGADDFCSFAERRESR